MEITLAELADALRGGNTPTPGAVPFAEHLIGKRVLVRTRISGVSAGTLRAATATPAGFQVVLDDAVRVWRWEGGALGCAELATKGPDSLKSERHPDGAVITDEGMEVLPVTETAWERLNAQ